MRPTVNMEALSRGAALRVHVERLILTLEYRLTATVRVRGVGYGHVDMDVAAELVDDDPDFVGALFGDRVRRAVARGERKARRVALRAASRGRRARRGW